MRKQTKRKLLSMMCVLALTAGILGGFGVKKADIVNAANTQIGISFLGGSVRMPEGYAVGAAPKDKEVATGKADLRFGYTITLPTGLTMADINWSWQWGVEGITGTRTVIGVNYIELGNNSYRTNLVITGIPVDTDYATNIHAVLKASVKNSTDAAVTDTQQTRSVKQVAEEIKSGIDAGTSTETAEIQDYVNCLIGTETYSNGTLWNTDSEEALGGHSSTIYTWLSQYDGEEGVIRWKGTGDDVWGYIFRSVSPMFAKEVYAGSDTLIFKVKTDDPDGLADIRYFAEGQKYELTHTAVTDAWTQAEIPLTNINTQDGACEGNFENFWDKFVTNNSSMIWCDGRSSDDVSIYIADIKLAKKAAVTSSITKAAIGQELVLSNIDDHTAVFSGLKNISCYVTRPDGSHYVVTNGSFTPEQKGTYTVSYQAENSLGSVTYGSYQLKVYEAGTLWDTDSEAVLGGHATAVSWLKSYEGQDGVICVNSGAWAHLFRGSSPVFDKSYYEGSDTLLFKIKTDDPDGAANFLYFAEGKYYDLTWTSITDTWTEVEIPLTNTSSAADACEGNFENFWQKFIENSTSMIFCGDASSADVKVYIADIRLIKK